MYVQTGNRGVTTSTAGNTLHSRFSLHRWLTILCKCKGGKHCKYSCWSLTCLGPPSGWSTSRHSIHQSTTPSPDQPVDIRSTNQPLHHPTLQSAIRQPATYRPLHQRSDSQPINQPSNQSPTLSAKAAAIQATNLANKQLIKQTRWAEGHASEEE